MKALKWTELLPTESGWYWRRWSNGIVCMDEFTFRTNTDGKQVLTNAAYEQPHQWDGEFAGPIPEPEETMNEEPTGKATV